MHMYIVHAFCRRNDTYRNLGFNFTFSVERSNNRYLTEMSVTADENYSKNAICAMKNASFYVRCSLQATQKNLLISLSVIGQIVQRIRKNAQHLLWKHCNCLRESNLKEAQAHTVICFS